MPNYGLDVGTMNLVSAKLNDNKIDIKLLRNVFIEVDKDAVQTMDLSKISYVEIDDSVFILSEDAYNFANIFGQVAKRPMAKGMISTSEIDSVDILGIMIKQLIGKSNNENEKVCYSIPANPIDGEMNVIYHKNVFSRIIESLGYEVEPVNEATAIIYAECQSTNFSGIGISFGAGMTNIAIVYKSIPASTFSIARGGDWIDINTANSLGAIPNRVTLIKETRFNLNDFMTGTKKDRRIKEGLFSYYNSLINYTVKNITKQLDNLSMELPESLPVVISGGTSLVDGFIPLVEKTLKNYEFPFEISEVRHAKNPLTTVAEGCLIKALKK